MVHTQGRMIEQLDDVLDRAQGFVGTTEQDRFDECEEAVNEVLQDIRKFAQHVKVSNALFAPDHFDSQVYQPVLAKSKYYEALGVIVNAALGRVLQDVLALPDITEVESHKLNDLCRILNALEGLFVEDPSQVRHTGRARFEFGAHTASTSLRSWSRTCHYGSSFRISRNFW